MHDREAVTLARSGSNEAWAQIVEQHQEAVFRLSYLILGNAEDAEDIAQETFVRAFRFLSRFDEQQPLRPWLLQIARNLAANHRRSLRRYWRAVRRQLTAAEVAAVAPPVGETLAALQAERLWRAVQRLSQQDQELIYVRYFLALSTAETAAALDIAPGTVKSRLHRALTRLRAVVEATDPVLREEWLA